MTRPLNRRAPLMAPGNYQTFQIVAPVATHFRKATCAEVECVNYANGWRTRIQLLSTEDAERIRKSGMAFREVHVADGEDWFYFDAGQPCFLSASHRKSLERPEILIVRGGDWRGNPTGRKRVHGRWVDWVDEFATHQGSLNDAAARG